MFASIGRHSVETRGKGYISLAPLSRGETRWHFGADRDYGLWHVAIHGFGLRLEVIGPFTVEASRARD
jgi:hypothetical protein